MNNKNQTAQSNKIRCGIGALLLATIIAIIFNELRESDFSSSTIKNATSNNNKNYYPTCQCGDKMTIFDGVWWYTCPNCGNKKKITNTKEQWYDEIFKSGSKEIIYDFELADLGRGGDLSEE